jgi:hypothetical protein
MNFSKRINLFKKPIDSEADKKSLRIAGKNVVGQDFILSCRAA